MKALLCSLLVFLALSACSGKNKSIAPTINVSEFDGISIKENQGYADLALSGYEFRNVDGKTIVYHTCPEATGAKESEIAEFEFFRYRLLLNSCQALKIYQTAKASAASYFPVSFDATLVNEMPATSVPLLNKSQEVARIGKTVKSYFVKGQLTQEKNGSVKLITDDDEIRYTLLARGDFTNDGVEDLLVRSEWYARKANGKHVDLLLLTKAAKDKPTTIEWRLMKN